MSVSNLDLRTKAIELTEDIRNKIAVLQEDDPLHSWFTIELNTIGLHAADPDLTLDEANARICALNQLQFLVFRHQMLLRNPAVETAEVDRSTSVLTAAAAIPSNVLKSARDYRFSIAPALLHEPTTDNDQFDPVSPTAKIVGYLRGMDKNLKLIQSNELRLEGERLLDELGISEPTTRASMAVLFQSRYRAINAAIASTSAEQVVEFAAGNSPRGLQWSRTSPGTIYIESDLPQLMIHKAKLIRNTLMAESFDARGILHCRAVDVLDQASVFDCLAKLDANKPFCVVTEGLLLYFSEAEMRTFCEMMSGVLDEYPSATWVTDFVSQQNLRELFASSPDVARGVKDVFSLTGRSVVPDNPFQTEFEIEQWLNDHDLAVERTLPLSAATEMLDFEIPIPQSLREQIVGSRKIWCVRATESTPLID